LVGTLVFLLLLALLLTVLLAVVLLPVMAIGFYFWKWELTRARRRTLVKPGEPLLIRLENTNC
jgi:uncharacterized protein HemY